MLDEITVQNRNKIKERLEAFNSQPERVAWRARIPIMDFNELR